MQKKTTTKNKSAPISSKWKITFKKNPFINPLLQKEKSAIFQHNFFLNDKMGGVCFGGN
jgi:hypothetical protein